MTYPPVAICPRCERYADAVERQPDDFEFLPTPYIMKSRPLVVHPCGHEVDSITVYVGLGE